MKEFMSSISLDIDLLKYSSLEEIELAINRMSTLYLSTYPQLLEVVQKNKKLFLVDPGNPQKFLQAVFLSLILASGGSTPGDKNLRDSVISKVSIICDRLGLTYGDVLDLTLYEVKFLSLLNR